tara:strand:+ start:818 stop:1531 length:714 start_codon:yes stop_codon:yes gene_type:complete
MADINDILENIAVEFASKVDIATSELVEYLSELVKGKSSAESLEILSSINLDKAYELKLSKAFSSYEAGVIELLRQTYTTVSLQESSIRALLNTTKKSVMDNMKVISSTTIQGVIDGISTGKTTGETLATIRGQIANPELVVNTAYNQFNNTLTTLLADELPSDTKWIYVGAYDGSTRERCEEKILFSGSEGKTQAEIISRFGDMNNEIWRCRHKWTQRSSSPEDQNYNIKKFTDNA